MRAAILSVMVLVWVSSVASADALLVGRVTDLLGKPVAGARVHVLDGGVEKQAVTDKDGNYRVVVDGDRDVSVVIGAGNLHTFRRGAIKDGRVQRLDLEVELAEGEIIRIIDQKPPAVLPKLPKDAPHVTPPYSPEAVVRDAWAKAWLLLDIDETGKVLRVKLVKRPGFGLDEIAIREAMKLHFEPALDERGKPMRTRMFWAMEWPSHGWLIEHNGTASRMPVESYAIDPFMRGFGGLLNPAAPNPQASSLGHVPCAGSGPLNLDLRYPVYRDCSKPNVKKVAELPWLDGTQPIPPDPPSIARKPEPPVQLSRASYVPQITMSGVTATLLAANAYSFVQFRKYSRRVSEAAHAGVPVVDLEQYRSDVAGNHRWARLAILATVATIGAGSTTALLWLRHQPKSELSVQPEDDGSGSASISVSFSGSF
jgi:hypothetical protein